MFSQNYIVYLSNKAAVEAALGDDIIEPYVITDQFQVNAWESARSFPFPNLGALRPAGWKLVDNWLVDTSGLGRESEPSLTIRGLSERLRENLSKGRFAYGIIEVSQFQIVLGVFEPDPEAALSVAGEITDDDWDQIASELGFESGQDLRSYVNL